MERLKVAFAAWVGVRARRKASYKALNLSKTSTIISQTI